MTTPLPPAPFSLVAEITHRCPLHCVYCSNPLELRRAEEELTTQDWLRVLEEAHALGVVQLHLSGGEPLVRRDLESVVRRGRELDFYTNLITSGAGLTRERAEALAACQYYGWALLNRAGLLPTKDQVLRAETVYEKKKAECKGRMELIWVRPDYYEPLPKPCMGGWGQIHLIVGPDGSALPCPAASSIRTLHFENVRDFSLGWIWRESPAFNQFRGFDWMPDPCRSCDRRFQDFGGCRCQAFALTGDAARTDPVCQWAPDHTLVETAVAAAQQQDAAEKQAASKNMFRQFTYRPDPGVARSQRG